MNGHPIDREPDGTEPSTPARPRRASRHDDAVLSAEVRRLVRALRTYGPLQRASLTEFSGAERGREGSFDRAVAEALREGQPRALPFDLIAADRPGAVQPGRSGSSAP